MSALSDSVLTVAICGFVRHFIFAVTLPLLAGRYIYNVSPSVSSEVQSAHSPVFKIAAAIGAFFLPHASAFHKITSGFFSAAAAATLSGGISSKTVTLWAIFSAVSAAFCPSAQTFLNFARGRSSFLTSFLSVSDIFLILSISGKSSSNEINLQCRRPLLFSNVSRTRVGEPFMPHLSGMHPIFSLFHTSTLPCFEKILGNRRVRHLSAVIKTGIFTSAVPPRVTAVIQLFSRLRSITFVMRETPMFCASIGPICAVSPSMLCLPQIIMSNFNFFIACDKIYAVARVSEPA